MAEIGIRSHDWIGPHRVCWLEGVPESVEEFVGDAIRRFPDLLPTEAPLVISWNHWEDDPQKLFDTRWVRDEGGAYRLITVGDGWWKRPHVQREFDFVMTLLIAHCADNGVARVGREGLELEVGDQLLVDDEATAWLNNTADELIDAR